MKPFYLVVLPPLFLAACAQQGAEYTPILDGAAGPGYHGDLSACQALARNQRQFDRQTAGSAALGAGVGALLGAADDDGDAAGAALAGALAGGAAGAVDARDRRKAIVVECLRGRGHAVVG